ncbi:alcohol dehydrogenase catalytic domain-containing protein [Microbacterium sp. CPCC 204701]|uniref:alcohol dehydrogenase catalytic domain-containing protein n=1 Tax=Microbacterium sp. CPCC 204701 TaxID=2493084 RepID=UPI0013E3F35D|nr:alcohol dehydrogenase catalytic domain-containing protein [Microbacterium sp. CPCC 204701]
MLTGSGSLELVDDVVVDPPQSGEVRVRVEWCGVCHSDLHVLDGDTPSNVPHAILGHEVAGIVDAIGDGVTDLAPGDHVVVSMLGPCGDCEACFSGATAWCERQYGRGGVAADGSTRMTRGGMPVMRITRVGGFVEYTIARQEAVVKVPDELPLDLATVLGCSVQTGFGAVVNIAEVAAGSTVAVFGLGGVGLAAIQAARIAGATTIVGIDPIESRRSLAESLGATSTWDPVQVSVDEARALTGPLLFRSVIDTVSSARTLPTAASLTGPKGTLVILGITESKTPLEGLLTADIVAGQKRVMGCYLGNGIPRRDVPRLVRLWQHGLLDLDSMVTGRRPLDQIDQAFADLRAGIGLRTAVRVSLTD